MEILNYLYFLLAGFFIVGPIGMGAYALFFSRRFSLGMYRWRKTVWKVDFNEFDLKVGQVFAAVIGAVLLIGGIIVAVRLLF